MNQQKALPRQIEEQMVCAFSSHPDEQNRGHIRNQLHGRSDEEKRIDLETLIREDFERCHPDDTFDDLKKRASFSKEDKGLLRDWMAIAAHRAGAYRKRRP